MKKYFIFFLSFFFLFSGFSFPDEKKEDNAVSNNVINYSPFGLNLCFQNLSTVIGRGLNIAENSNFFSASFNEYSVYFMHQIGGGCDEIGFFYEPVFKLGDKGFSFKGTAWLFSFPIACLGEEKQAYNLSVGGEFNFPKCLSFGFHYILSSEKLFSNGVCLYALAKGKTPFIPLNVSYELGINSGYVTDKTGWYSKLALNYELVFGNISFFPVFELNIIDRNLNDKISQCILGIRILAKL
jgi:hypothetical protein